MCIRCSGIHRGMGVHITRIKSVDLDTWSPEQIANIQRWGNKRANAYWEAHLKQGHMPPEHKMESFIRSKYETKRWALEGPVPDPESLDDDDDESPEPSSSASIPAPTSSVASTRKPTAIDLLAGPPRSSSTSSRTAAPAPPSATVTPLQTPQPAPVPAPPPVQGGGIFDLDFSAPAPQPVQRKDPKADILSLFASAPSIAPTNQQQHARQSSFGIGKLSLGGPAAVVADPWGAPTQQYQQRPPQNVQAPPAPVGGGWGGFESYNQPPPPSKPPNDLFGSGTASTDVWGSSSTAVQAAPDPFGEFAGGGFGGSTAGGGKKVQDAFSDIWA